MEPNSQLVQRAIALQLNQTQQKSQQIGLDFRGFKINRVAITQQEPLSIQGSTRLSSSRHLRPHPQATRGDE